MRKRAGLAVAAVLVLAAAGFTVAHFAGGIGRPARASVRVATSTRTYSLTAGGRKRSYEVIAPAGGLPQADPVIIALSGLGATVPEEVSRDQLVPYVSADEAELVYPVAYSQSWNATGCCGLAAARKVNDLAFLQALVPAVDPRHARPVYVMGFSNGARLAYRVACTDPGLFDAYAMVKGVPLAGCVVRTPVTLIQLASVNDPEIPYKLGDHGLEPLPVTTEVAALHTADGCPAKAAVTHAKDLTLTSWSGCAAGTRFAFAAWPGGAHLFPRPPVTKQGAAPVIWAFLTNTALAPLP
jgi:polyhydroxybutyrate depolymerase